MLELNKEKKEINGIHLTIRENLIEIALEREYKSETSVSFFSSFKGNLAFYTFKLTLLFILHIESSS